MTMFWQRLGETKREMPLPGGVDERSAKRMKLEHHSARAAGRALLAAPSSSSYAQSPVSPPTGGPPCFDLRACFGGARGAPPRKSLAHTPRRSPPPLRSLLQRDFGFGFGGSRLPAAHTQPPAPVQASPQLADFSHLCRPRPDATPFAPVGFQAALLSLGGAPRAGPASRPAPLPAHPALRPADAFATPSSHTQALQEKRLEAARRSAEADSGAPIRAFESRAARVVSEDLTAVRRVRSAHPPNVSLSRSRDCPLPAAGPRFRLCCRRWSALPCPVPPWPCWLRWMRCARL